MGYIKDITINGHDLKAQISLSEFNARIDKAQRWLEQEIVKKMLPVIPRKSGNLLGEIQAANSSMYGSGYVRVAQNYGVYLYPGIAKNGNPFNWTNPQTQPEWGHYTIETYRSELEQGVEKILKGG